MEYNPIPLQRKTSFEKSTTESLYSNAMNNQTKPKIETKPFLSFDQIPNITKNDKIGENIYNVFKDYQKENSFLNQSTSTQSKSFSNCSFAEKTNQLREKYYTQLVVKQLMCPVTKPKPFTSITIFDWDDTLFATSFLMSNGRNANTKNNSIDMISKLEKNIFILLEMCIKKGNVYIITNAEAGWVEQSSKQYYPNLQKLLSKVTIISARDKYHLFFPADPEFWKIQAFLDITKTIEKDKVANIICIGDSHIEIEAGNKLREQLSEPFIKTIKLRECPHPFELNKQITLIINKFDDIYNVAKNLTISVGRRKHTL
jgi:hypothetical protein